MSIISRISIIVLISFVLLQGIDSTKVHSQSESLSFEEYKNHSWRQDLWQMTMTTPTEVTDAQVECGSFYEASDWWAIASQAFVNNAPDIIYRTQCNPSQNLTNHPAADIDPTLNLDGSQIAFASNRTGNYEIYVVNADGNNLRQLTANSLNNSSLDWSPSNRIVFTAGAKEVDNEIWVMNGDGTNQQQLTANDVDDVDPAWTPDGNRVFWIQIEANGIDGSIWQMNPDGSGPSQLAGPFRYLSHLAISSDGQRIVFDADLTGDYANDVAVIGIDGTNLTTIAEGYVYDVGLYLNVGEMWAGSWTPDDRLILYSALEYYVDNNGVTLLKATINSYCLVSNNCPGTAMQDVQLNYNPDIANTDFYPPISQLFPLPAFSRQSDIVFQWQTANQGPAPLSNILIQQKSELDPDWVDFYSYGNFRSLPRQWVRLAFPLGSGHKAFFRMRAEDFANNTEAYPSANAAETFTIPFAKWMEGKITDNRNVAKQGYAISSEPAAIESITTDTSGHYLARFANSETYLLNNSFYTIGEGDTHHDVYLFPKDSVVKNGSFEAGSAVDWSTQNATLDPTKSAIGVASIRLGGIDCRFACMSALDPPIANANVNVAEAANTAPDMTIDSLAAGKEHVYALGRKGNEFTVFFSESIKNGAWSQPLPISNQPNVIGYHMLIGSDEVVYVLLVHREGQMQYITRLADRWSLPTDIAQGTLLSWIAAPKGGFHFFYERRCTASQCAPGQSRIIAYRFVSASGTVSDETLVFDDTNLIGTNRTIVYPPQLAPTVDEDGTLHLFHSEYTAYDESIFDQIVPRIFHRVRSPNGEWSSPSQIQGIYGAPVFANINASDELQLIFSSANLYAMTLRAGTWQEPMMIEPVGRSLYFGVDKGSDIIYIISNNYSVGHGSMFYRLGHDGTILDRQAMDLPFYYGNYQPFAVSGPNNLHYLSGSIEDRALYSSQLLTEPLDSSISQSVFIAETLHKPTLSFLYLSDASAYAHAYFDLSVSTNVTSSTPNTDTMAITPILEVISSTQLFSTTSSTPWRLKWVDMAAWQGKTVTITFTVHQIAGDTPMQVYVDEISLGSWKTPKLTAISPLQLDGGVATTLVITGENFVHNATVKLGNVSLQNVKWVSETRLEATIPATFAPGSYWVEVINSENDRVQAPMTVHIGKSLFLPLIVR